MVWKINCACVVFHIRIGYWDRLLYLQILPTDCVNLYTTSERRIFLFSGCRWIRARETEIHDYLSLQGIDFEFWFELFESQSRLTQGETLTEALFLIFFLPLTFGVLWDWYSSKLKGKPYRQNTSPKSYKTEIKILANPGLA